MSNYAEPKVYEPLKIEVLPADSDIPVLVKEPRRTFDVAPAPSGQLARPNSSLGRPHNLPERQNSLRVDGQYRTIEVVTPQQAAQQQKQTDQLNSIKMNGLTSPGGVTNNYARDQALAEAAYYSGFAISGFWEGIQGKQARLENGLLPATELEKLTYEGGNRAGEELHRLIKEALDNGRKVKEDLWKNRPRFEIPEIKIPQFEKPHIPEIKLPDIKFPELPKPTQPKIDIKKREQPIPKDKKRQLKELDLSPCGQLIFRVAYTRKVLGYQWNEENSSFDAITVATSIKEINSVINRCYYKTESPTDFLNVIGGSGVVQNVDLGLDIRFRIYYGEGGFANENCAYRNPPFGGRELPFYDYNSVDINVLGRTDKNAIAAIIDYLDQAQYPMEVYEIQVSRPTAKGCPITQPPPLPEPPPVPEEKDCCRMGCCPKPTEINYRLIQQLMERTLQKMKFSIDVPVVRCELNESTQLWEPKTSNKSLEVFATSKEQAAHLQRLHQENAYQAAQLCEAKNNENECYASVPDYWQTRSPQKPQLCIQYAENLGNGKIGRSRWTLTIPHYRYGKSHKPTFPAYKKGGFRGVQVLNDNSKIIVWCVSDTECLRVINSLKQYVSPEFLKNIEPPQVTNSHNNLKNTSVIPTLCQFFPTGQKDTVPEWSKKLREKPVNK